MPRSSVAVVRPESPPTTSTFCALQDASRGEEDGTAAEERDMGCCPSSVEGFSTAIVGWLFNANAVSRIGLARLPLATVYVCLYIL